MESENGISRREFLRRSAGAGLFAFVPFGLEKFGSYWGEDLRNPDWDNFAPGEQVFGVAREVIDGLNKGFTKKDDKTGEVYTVILDEKIPNKKVRDYKDVPLPLHRERYMVNPGTILRMRILDRDWAKVLKRNDIYSPFEYPKSNVLYNGDLYVKYNQFDPVMPIPPLSVFKDTKPEDKKIVTLFYPYPETMLIEKNKIVLRCPAFLGGHDTPTPVGVYTLSTASLSVHMPDHFIGVPYCLLFDYTRGLYLHEAPWIDWKKVSHGGYMSSGCNNLPGSEWRTIRVGDREISYAHFVFLWSLTNFPNYDIGRVEDVRIDIKSPAAKNRIRFYVLPSIDSLKGRFEGDKDIINQYRSFGVTEFFGPPLS
jgi:hypothetical protein